MRIQRVTPDVYSFNLLLRAVRDCGVGDQLNDNNSILLEDEPAHKYLPSGRGPTNSAKNSIDQPSDALPNLLVNSPVQMTNVIALTQLDRSENR